MEVTDLQQLFSLALQHEKMLVYGNLGRLSKILVEYLSTHHPMLDILIVSKFYNFPSSHKIRQVSPEEAQVTKCDLLIYAEPIPYTVLDRKPFLSARLLILSSHLLFIKKKNEIYTNAVYFHNMNGYVSKKTQLLKRKDGLQEMDHIEMARKRIDFINVVTIGPSDDSDIILGKSKPLENRSYVLVNLTKVTSPLTMMLFYWDAFDYMLDNLDHIERWSVCFPEKGSYAFESFTQECINQIFCYNFSMIKEILSFIPYYKSGIIDRSFNVPTSRFVNMEYVDPKTLVDALKANVRYDLEPIVGSVYRLK